MYVGILAGMWPCGIITLTDELYLAESNSQVYGSIHSLMQNNPSSTSTISKFTLMLFYSHAVITIMTVLYQP